MSTWSRALYSLSLLCFGSVAFAFLIDIAHPFALGVAYALAVTVGRAVEHLYPVFA